MEAKDFIDAVKGIHSVQPLGHDKFLVKSGSRSLVFLVVDVTTQSDTDGKHMDRPDGKWKCRACGTVWNGQDVGIDPFHFGWVCGDVFCGATVDKVSK